jgi:hypothetical protein
VPQADQIGGGVNAQQHDTLLGQQQQRQQELQRSWQQIRGCRQRTADTRIQGDSCLQQCNARACLQMRQGSTHLARCQIEQGSTAGSNLPYNMYFTPRQYNMPKAKATSHLGSTTCLRPKPPHT